MSRKGPFVIAVAAAGLFGAGIVLAQDPTGRDVKKDNQQNRDQLDKGKPLIDSGAGSGLKAQCENALRTKDYLRELKIAIREEGSGRIVCEGTVPTKVHACAVFLTCMSVNGVGQVDLSKLRIEHWGSETSPPTAGTDVRKGLDKAITENKLSMYAVVLNPAEKGVTTQPAGVRTFKNDVIVIGDVPLSQLPPKPGASEPGLGPNGQQIPDGNPANQVPNKNTQTPANDQPVAPHNPGAYPNNPK